MSARNRRRRGKSGDEQMNEYEQTNDPYAGADADVLFGRSESSRRTAGHKDEQLCEQVFQILSYVIGSLEDDVLSALAIESVSPGVDSSRLLVTVVAMDTHPIDDIVERLAKSRGLLRSEIAAGIHRKRTPELSFRVMSRAEVER